MQEENGTPVSGAAQETLPAKGIDAPSLSPGADAWRRLRRNPVAVVSGCFVLLLVLITLCAGFAPYGYDAPDTHYDSLPAPPDARHLLGTDNLGQDVFSRLLYGTRVSLGVAVTVIVIELLIGVSMGLFAGYRGGKIDLLLMRLTDVMFAFPDILLAILIAAILRSGSTPLPPVLSFAALVLALGVVAWPGLARLVRGQALALREKEFIEAARAMGVSEGAILWRHMLPNLLSPIIIAATQDLAGVILAEATLSFLGLGVQPPYPSWGRMINDALPY